MATNNASEEMVTPENIDEAQEEEMIQPADDENKKRDELCDTYQKEIDAYNKGLQIDPNNAELYYNRALTFLNMKKFLDCETDCTSSMEKNTELDLPYPLRASARILLAKQDLQAVLKLKPNNQRVMEILEHLKKLYDYNLNTGSTNTSLSSLGTMKFAEKKVFKIGLVDEIKLLMPGEYDILVAKNEEDDLIEIYNACKKQNTHTCFIPIKEFKMEHLPERLRDKVLYEWIKAEADMTVRISVDKITTNRPGLHHRGQASSKMERSVSKLGTGHMFVVMYIDGVGYNFAGRVKLSDQERNLKTCPCEKCKKTGIPKNVWWRIQVNTEPTLITDDYEARHTSCRVFFDEPNCPVITLDKSNFNNLSRTINLAVLEYATCDQLGGELYNKANQYLNLLMNVVSIYQEKTDEDFCFIVSHPHGLSKHVSFGTFESQKFKIQNDHVARLLYTTPACPGSIGAHVCYLRSNYMYYHSGTSKDLNRNFSTASGCFE